MSPSQSRPKLHYRLTVPDVPGKRLEVRLAIEDLEPGPLRLRMPAWIPGSYCIREFAGQVAWLEAQAGGQPLPVSKEDKSTWVITLDQPGTCEVRYQVYAGELTVRTNDISHDHAFVSPGATFAAVVGREHEPALLTVDPPGGWTVATALDRVESPDGPFAVEDFDTLVDSPLELGPHEVHSFEVAGTRHDLVIHGDGNFDLDRMLEDMQKIVACEVDLFGELPSPRYLFILLLTDLRGGGLEHMNSSVLAWPKLKFRPDKEYRKFLTLVAHEYFHLWNVKRIRPETLLSLDYSQEMYTRSLWVFEGITSYYDTLVPLRASTYSAEHYLELLAEHITIEASRGGRRRHSLADSSFDTWIKLYRPTPDSYNTQISYYEKGHLLAFLLDHHLREQSQNGRSLDDVMRHMYVNLYKQGRGLPEHGLGAIIAEATGVDVTELLAEHVDAPSQLEFDATFARVGLRIRPKKRDEDDTGTWLGARFEVVADSCKLSHVARGGPAHRGGLMAGDEVVALDGHRVRGDLKDRVELYRPGETVGWTAFRRDRLVEGTLEFQSHAHPPQEIVPLEDTSSAQKASFESWTHVAWEEAFGDESPQEAPLT